MDKIQKFLRSLRPKEQEVFSLLLAQLERNYKKVPGITAVKRNRRWLKIRMGRYRIIFKVQKGNVEILRITKRNELPRTLSAEYPPPCC